MEAEELKISMIIESNGCCSVCKKSLRQDQLQLAHIIPKYDRYLKLYGYYVIHHRKNMVITCANCNSSVMLNPATHPVEAAELIKEIVKCLAN